MPRAQFATLVKTEAASVAALIKQVGMKVD